MRIGDTSASSPVGQGDTCRKCHVRPVLDYGGGLCYDVCAECMLAEMQEREAVLGDDDAPRVEKPRKKRKSVE